MARKESDLVKQDSWNVTGLVNPDHVMSDWAERRLKGTLTAELTEACRQEIGQNVLGLNMSESESRKTVADWIKTDANQAAYDTIRTRLRGEAQSEFEAGTYGAGSRGPLADPPRVTALMPFIVELNATRGRNFDPASVSRSDRIEMVSKFEAAYGGPKGKYHREIAKLTEGLAAPKTAEMVADL
jgi:hypothetical protein